MSNNEQPRRKTKQRQKINPQQMRTTGTIFLAVGLVLAILFVGLSITQNNWRFLYAAAAPMAFEIITGIVYVSIGSHGIQNGEA